MGRIHYLHIIRHRYYRPNCLIQLMSAVKQLIRNHRQYAPGLYSTGQAAQYAGMNVGRLNHWLSRGIVTSTRLPNGAGTYRKWTLQDIVILRVAISLREVHFSLPVVQLICDGLRKRAHDDLEPIVLTSPAVRTVVSVKDAHDLVLNNIKNHTKGNQ